MAVDFGVGARQIFGGRFTLSIGEVMLAANCDGRCASENAEKWAEKDLFGPQQANKGCFLGVGIRPAIRLPPVQPFRKLP